MTAFCEHIRFKKNVLQGPFENTLKQGREMQHGMQQRHRAPDPLPQHGLESAVSTSGHIPRRSEGGRTRGEVPQRESEPPAALFGKEFPAREVATHARSEFAASGGTALFLPQRFRGCTPYFVHAPNGARRSATSTPAPRWCNRCCAAHTPALRRQLVRRLQHASGHRRKHELRNRSARRCDFFATVIQYAKATRLNAVKRLRDSSVNTNRQN